MLIPNFLNIRFAIQGIITGMRTEAHIFWLAVSAVVMLVIAVIFGITKAEAVMLVILFVLTIAFEAVNTAIEGISDIVQPTYDKRIRKIKDIASGTVLLIGITAFGVWVLFVFF